jgi:hypothetical protein
MPPGGAAPGGGAAGALSNVGRFPVIGTWAAALPIPATARTKLSAATQRKVISRIPLIRSLWPLHLVASSPRFKQPADFGDKAANLGRQGTILR